MRKIGIINGPNLSLLGKREPHLYGKHSFDAYLDDLRGKQPFSSLEITYYQNNHEGEIIDRLHAMDSSEHGVVLNAGAYSHTSLAIADAIRAISVPVIEVHLSNIYAREEFRKHSFTAPACVGSIIGLGLLSYKLALVGLLEILHTCASREG